MADLDKAKGFHDQRNWVQSLRYGELAATKLKQLKDRRLETVQAIDAALGCKYDALQFMDRHREAMECKKECYTLWAMNHLRNPGSIKAALSLIQSCIHNKEFEDAERYARHAMFMINEMTDNFIPSDQRPRFLADGSYYLAQAIYRSAVAGGIPAEEKQKAGEEAITLARQALEIRTQLHGTESVEVALVMGVLADVLNYFNILNNDEVIRLYEQAIAIFGRVEGRSTVNVAACKNNLGSAYSTRANRAQAANDLGRCIANLELALPHLREAARIFRATNHVDRADKIFRIAVNVEENIRRIRITKEAEAAATRG